MRTSSTALLFVVFSIAAGCSLGSSEGTDGLSASSIPSEYEITETAADAEYAIRRCMVEQGYEYTPRSHSLPGDVGGARSEMTRFEYAAEFGYGISIADMTNQEQPIEPALEVDVESQGPEYQIALYGTGLTDSATGQTDIGCSGEAFESEFSSILVQLDTLAEVRELVEGRLRADPRIVDAHGAWSRCMGGAGFPSLVDTDEIREKLRVAYGELLASPDGVVEGSGGLGELQGLELALATADATCTEEQLAPVYDQVRPEIENKVLVEYPELSGRS